MADAVARPASKTPTRLRAERSWQAYAGDPRGTDAREGDWTPEELAKMDAKFCSAVERARAAGLENPPATGPQEKASKAARHR